MSMTLAEERFIRVFQYVLVIKYGALSIEAVVRFGRFMFDVGLTEAIPDLWTVRVTSLTSSIPVFIAFLLWIRRDRLSYGMVAMALAFGHAVVSMLHAGQGYANHYFLESLVGILGMLAVGRQMTGETERRAWDAMAWLGIAVWGLGGAKKLLHFAYHDGEFLASLAHGERRTLFAGLSRTILGDADVPGQCCVTGDLDVAGPAAVTLIVLGVGMALAEMSPVVASRLLPRARVGWLMLGLAIVATSIANEMRFGLVLSSFAALWGEGRFFRRTAVVVAIGLAAAYLAGPLF